MLKTFKAFLIFSALFILKAEAQTATFTQTNTNTQTQTATQTVTGSVTSTPTQTATATNTLTLTGTGTLTFTSTQTPTQTLTATTNMRNVDLLEYDVTDGVNNGVTVTALPAGWNNFRCKVQSVNWLAPTITGNTLIKTQSLDILWFIKRLYNPGAVEFHVLNRKTLLPVDTRKNPIVFSFWAIRKNFDYPN